MGIVRSTKIKYDDADPKARLLGHVGDISEYVPLNNKVLVATYKRAEKTAGGIIVDTDEDEYQSKTGLIIAVGDAAFDNSDGKWFRKNKPKLGDWVSFKGSAGQQMDINGWPCRVFPDTAFDMIVPSPDSVW